MKKNNSFLFSLFILLAAIMIGCSASPELGDYNQVVKDQMHEMMNVLNAGHYREFMGTYVSPAYVKSMGGVDAALLQFGNTRQQALYNALRVARNITPFYDKKTQTLTYVNDAIPIPLAFKKESGKWYLQGDWFKP